MTGQHWTTRALCAEVDTEIFFPERGGSNKAARQVCAECPVQAECLEESLVNFVYGIWANTSEGERRRLRRERGIIPRYLGSNLYELDRRANGYPCRHCETAWDSAAARKSHEIRAHPPQPEEQAS